MKQLAFGLVLCTLLTGCAWRTQIDHGVLSTYAMDIGKSYEVDRSQKITAADRAHGVWIVPLGSPDADVAVKKAIDEANKTSKRTIVGIADTEVKFRFLWMYFYSQRWYSVEGYPIYEK